MKKAALITLTTLAILSGGCTKATMTAQNGHRFEVSSFLQKKDIGRFQVNPDGTATLENYHSDGGIAALQAIVEGAVKGAVKGAK